jgi:hypothetical protein
MKKKRAMMKALRLCLRAMSAGRPANGRLWDRAFTSADRIVNPQDYDDLNGSAIGSIDGRAADNCEARQMGFTSL